MWSQRVIGFLLVLFGLKWLKNAIQRYSGLKFLHDEEAIYAANLAQARARGEAVGTRLDPFGVLLSHLASTPDGQSAVQPADPDASRSGPTALGTATKRGVDV
jgi:hypothetical protein